MLRVRTHSWPCAMGHIKMNGKGLEYSCALIYLVVRPAHGRHIRSPPSRGSRAVHHARRARARQRERADRIDRLLAGQSSASRALFVHLLERRCQRALLGEMPTPACDDCVQLLAVPCRWLCTRIGRTRRMRHYIFKAEVVIYILSLLCYCCLSKYVVVLAVPRQCGGAINLIQPVGRLYKGFMSCERSAFTGSDGRCRPWPSR